MTTTVVIPYVTQGYVYRLTMTTAHIVINNVHKVRLLCSMLQSVTII
jgi:hypothetical protein